MPLTDPADNTIMVDYDPFEDAREPVPAKDSAHAKDEHGQSHSDSEPSCSPLTPAAVGPDPVTTAHAGGWESLDGPVYYNSSIRNEDGNTRYVNHYINAKPEHAKHQTESHGDPLPNMTTAMIGRMFTPLPAHQQVNCIDSTKATCAKCAAREDSNTAPHQDGAFGHDFKSLVQKVAHLEKELGVTILHLVHEGQSWVRKAHHHEKSTDAQGKEHELDLTRVGKVPSHNDPRQKKTYWTRIAETSPYF